MPPINCGQCGASLANVDEVLSHAENAHPSKSHTPSGEIICPGCPGTFRQLVLLKRHLLEAHGM